MPICTAFGQMCMANITGVTPACGDTSQCSRCSEGQIFTCTSRTSFAYCSDGEAQGSGIFCPPDYFCSVYGAAVGSPCALVCEPALGDICDRDDYIASTTTLKDTRGISSLHTYEVWFVFLIEFILREGSIFDLIVSNSQINPLKIPIRFFLCY